MDVQYVFHQGCTLCRCREESKSNPSETSTLFQPSHARAFPKLPFNSLQRSILKNLGGDASETRNVRTHPAPSRRPMRSVQADCCQSSSALTAPGYIEFVRRCLTKYTKISLEKSTEGKKDHQLYLSSRQPYIMLFRQDSFVSPTCMIG